MTFCDCAVDVTSDEATAVSYVLLFTTDVWKRAYDIYSLVVFFAFHEVSKHMTQ